MTITHALALLDLADCPDDALVKGTYRAVVRVVHPDRHNGSATANRLLRRYTEARDTLLDVPQSRRRRRVATGSRGNPGRGSQSSSSSYDPSSQQRATAGESSRSGSSSSQQQAPGAEYWPPGFDPGFASNAWQAADFRAHVDELATYFAKLGREARRGSRGAQVIVAGTALLACGLALKLFDDRCR